MIRRSLLSSQFLACRIRSQVPVTSLLVQKHLYAVHRDFHFTIWLAQTSVNSVSGDVSLRARDPFSDATALGVSGVLGEMCW